MKTTILIIISLISVFSYSQTQIPNGNMENWSGINNPTVWNSFSWPFPEINSVVQTNDAYEGEYAAELTTQSTIFGTIPGLITLGNIDIENFSFTGGIEFNDRPTGISYYFKYEPNSTDSMFFAAVLTKWNVTDQKTDTIGFTAYFTGDTYTDYTYLAVPFFYTSEEIPDSLNVIITSSGFSGNAGSSLTIDNIIMEYGAVLSPTISFPAENISSSSFTANWFSIPDAVSYRVDVSEENSFSTFYSGIEDIDTGADTFYTVDVSPGIYFYRTRVFYDPEISINSNTIAVACPTICYDATNITGTNFTANWEAANNATNYYIDVSEDSNFETFVSGYENLSVGNQQSYTISGLNEETLFYYRVRTEYDIYISDQSNSISVTTGVANITTFDTEFSIFRESNNVIVRSHNINDGRISLYDIKGTLLNTGFINNGIINFSVNTPGIYILKYQNSKEVFTKKLSVIF